MKRALLPLMLIGILVIVTGCLSPWSCRGDFVWSCSPGIGFATFANRTMIEDNGGVSIIVLSLLLFISSLLMSRHQFVVIFSVICTVVLVVIALYRVIAAMSWQMAERSTPGGFTIQSGLFGMLIGVLLICASNLWRYRLLRQR